MHFSRSVLLLAIAVLLVPTSVGGRAHAAVAGLIPLIDLGTGFYLGKQGGLYDGGSNTLPLQHRTEGEARAAALAALPRIGFISIGLSNTKQEFCDGANTSTNPCKPWTFVGKALADAAVSKKIVFVNGATGGGTSTDWANPGHQVWSDLAGAVQSHGLTPADVRVAWLKTTRPKGATNLLLALQVEADLGQIMRHLKTKYPNVSMVFFSSRTYGGYGTLSPEPQAYENGFAVKWVIEAQIDQRAFGFVDKESGDLSLSRAPWMAWGPYLWANGTVPRSDGLVWLPSDFGTDGTHMSEAGAAKAAGLLMTFFKSASTACPWFLASGCGGGVGRGG